MRIDISCDSIDFENYAKAIKVFNNICIEWNLNTTEKADLAVSTTPNHESLVTMSRVFSIYGSLHTIFADDHQANSWVRKENTTLGLAAIELMKTRGGLEKIQNFLSSQAG